MNEAFQCVAIVDDDVRMLESVCDLLASAGYEARLFSSAESFLSANILADINAVVSDVGLPGMSGCELATAIKAKAPDMPIIMITGRESDEVREECRCAGASEFFSKPFKPQEFLQCLSAAINRQI